MKLLDGKSVADQIKSEIAAAVAEHVSQGKRRPHLAALLVGEDGASKTYVESKVRSCEQVGFESTLVHKSADISQEEVLGIIRQLNEDPSIDGYIVQLPLPKHINNEEVLLAIDPKKDVDGFHPENFGRMCLGLDCYLPATPFGIIELLRRSGVETSGKHCVVLGRSHIVGLPVSILLQRNMEPGNCTVTIAHSKTRNLKELCLQADIIIAAIGRPEFVTADMVKEGAVVVDVGITRLDDPSKKSGFRLAGDVKFDEVAPKCAYITPVPGGVGPMTIVSLLSNTLLAATKR